MYTVNSNVQSSTTTSIAQMESPPNMYGSNTTSDICNRIDLVADNTADINPLLSEVNNVDPKIFNPKARKHRL